MKTIILTLLVGAALLCAAPKTISYQGVLTDNNDMPKVDGSYDLTFSLYDVETEGLHLWRSTRKVAVSGGFFSVILGNETPFPVEVDFSKQYWLGIQVGADPELAPRVALTAAGYAIRASVADSAVKATSADVATVANTIKDGAVVTADAAADFKAPFAGIADSAGKAGTAAVALSVSGANVADTSITTSKIANKAVTAGKIDTTGLVVSNALYATTAGVANSVKAKSITVGALADTFVAPKADSAVIAGSVVGSAIIGDVITSRVVAKKSTGLVLQGAETKNIKIDQDGVLISDSATTNVVGLTVENKGANSIVTVKGNGARTSYGQDFVVTTDARLHLGSTEYVSMNIGSSEKMRITNSGNVGIGTDAPTYKLHLDLGANRSGVIVESDGNDNAYSDVVLKAKDVSSFTDLDVQQWTISHRKDGYFSDGGLSTLEFYGHKKGGGYFAPLALKNDGDVILASPKNATSGNVGIGKTNPGKKLDVNGAVRATSFLIGDTPVGTSTDTYWSTSGGGNIHYTGGSVGIGTSTPSYPLSVKGKNGYWNLELLANNADASYAGIQFKKSDGSHLGYILSSQYPSASSPYDQFGMSVVADRGDLILATRTETDTKVRLQTQAKDRLTVSENGNVGIGTTSPSAKLEVKGTTKITTTSGNVEIGALNTSWCHLKTDRPRFWMNASLQVDSGKIGAYDDNLVLTTGSKDQIIINKDNDSITLLGEIVQEDWIAPSLLNNWVNINDKSGTWSTAGYFKDKNGIVHLRGVVKGGSSVNAAIFTLPGGYQPEYQKLHTGMSADTPCRIEIGKNGNVWVQSGGSTAWVSLDGITFRAHH